MTIGIYLHDVETLYNIKFETTGEYAGYIKCTYISENCEAVDVIFRVNDTTCGVGENVITYTSSYIPEIERQSIEMYLANIAEKCSLENAIGIDNTDSESIFFVDIHAENHEYTLSINNDTYYDLDRWKVSEAIDEYCTLEASINRDLFERECMGYYD